MRINFDSGKCDVVRTTAQIDSVILFKSETLNLLQRVTHLMWKYPVGSSLEIDTFCVKGLW